MHTEEGRHRRRIVNNGKKVKEEVKEFVLDKTSRAIVIFNYFYLLMTITDFFAFLTTFSDTEPSSISVILLLP